MIHFDQRLRPQDPPDMTALSRFQTLITAAAPPRARVLELLRTEGLRWLWLGLSRTLLALLLLYIGLLLASFGLASWLFVLLPCGCYFALMLSRLYGLSFRDLSQSSLLWLYLALPLLYKITGINFVNLWQFPVLAVAALGLPALLREAGEQRWLQRSLMCWALFVVLACLSAMWAGHSKMSAALYQLFSDCKPVLLLGLGYSMARGGRPERTLWRLLAWAWLPLLLLMIWQWVSAGSYARVLPFPHAPAAEADGLLPTRAYGLFEHPGMLAGFVAPLSLLAGLRALADRAVAGRWWLASCLYGLILIGSGERGELAALLLALGAVYLWQRPERLLSRLVWLLPMLAVMVAGYWLLYGNTLINEAAAWGASKHAAIEHPRAQLYEGAIYLADKYFPLGNGIGTYGGAGASKYDLSTYLSLGFGGYWWFKGENYLLDIFWHNALAEGGWFAFLAQLAQYLLLAGYALIRYRRATGLARVYWGGAGFGVLYLLFNSPTSPVFQDPRLMVWSALCFGLAAQASRAAQDAQT